MRLIDYLKEEKWTKKWYSHMMDSKRNKVYSHHYGDWKIVPTGKHPTMGFAHKENKTYWAVENGEGTQYPVTFETLKRAKSFVEKEYK